MESSTQEVWGRLSKPFRRGEGRGRSECFVFMSWLIGAVEFSFEGLLCHFTDDTIELWMHTSAIEF